VRPIVIAAGGTGGHFFPAEALAATLIARGHRVVLMTDARSGALKSAVFSGGETHVLPGAGIAGRGVGRAVRAMAALARGTLRARQLLSGLDAGAIVGFGGYPSVPPVLGAHLLRRRPPIMLHEQNAVLGRANRFLARHADRLALGFADTARIPAGVPTCITGNPVRPAIQAVAASPYSAPVAGDIHLLVLGGSLGARVFSDVVPGSRRPAGRVAHAAANRSAMPRGGYRAGAGRLRRHFRSRRSGAVLQRCRCANGACASGDFARRRVLLRGDRGGGAASYSGAAAGRDR